MSLLLWKSRYEIGLPEIDMQHRRLVGMINELYDAMKLGQGQQVIDSILHRLIAYIQEHFSTEEAAMHQHAYPDSPAHAEEHLALTRQVIRMRDRRHAGDKVESLELMDLLRDWFREHITGSDKAFGRYLADREKGCSGLRD